MSVGGAAGGGARLTGSLGAISARLSVPRDDHERPHNVPGFYTTHTALYVPQREMVTPVYVRCNNCNVCNSSHRTIPRISTAVDASTLEAMGLGFTQLLKDAN